MPKEWSTLLLVVLGLVVLAGPGAADGNEPPNADAGLDQHVPNGTTVYLDAGGSTDPDGSVASVEWTITDPDGARVTHANETSAQTRFTPTRTGTYNATVAVTDDDGATRTDTLYVTVEAARGPEVTLTGPSETTSGDPTTFVVDVTADGVDLDEIRWIRNGTHQESRSLSGRTATVEFERTFDDTGRYRLRATVDDERSYRGSDSLTVQVDDGSAGGQSTSPCEDGALPKRWGDRDQYVTCRETAIETNNNRLITIPAANPDQVRYRDEGTLYTMGRDDAERLMQDDGWLTVSEIKLAGGDATIIEDIDADSIITDPESVPVSTNNGSPKQSTESSNGPVDGISRGDCYGNCPPSRYTNR